ncbi:uncharacterized protein LOC127869756 [Dreissena polymorpha]|uniref:uncharacterized protein LOC127869756 n=1 Tax=Dreissena polymorpha TaxID=45954 RepID=UPI0022648390|nr:uncharacterized protein LOC127869756 [Dreissena polymorpha]
MSEEMVVSLRAPIIDLAYERQKKTYTRELARQLERIPLLSGDHRCELSVQLLQQVRHLHEQSMVSECESIASLLQKPDERYQLRLELETESYNLNTVQTLANNHFMERFDASTSAETGKDNTSYARNVSSSDMNLPSPTQK